MTIFGLVHGAWHGAWCWDLVVEDLHRRGQRSVAVDLPTEDPAAGADAYADTVLRALAPYDEDVVLVGHGLAGLIVPVVADRRPVRRMVLVAPVLPEPGRSFADVLASESEILMPGLTAGQIRHDDGSSQWQRPAAIVALCPDAPPAVAEWAAARLRVQQWRVSQEVTPLTAWPPGEVRVVACANDGVVNPDWLRRAAKVRLKAEAHVLAGDHSPYLARPAELVDAILAT